MTDRTEPELPGDDLELITAGGRVRFYDGPGERYIDAPDDLAVRVGEIGEVE